jgi:hypothetical protein
VRNWARDKIIDFALSRKQFGTSDLISRVGARYQIVNAPMGLRGDETSPAARVVLG